LSLLVLLFARHAHLVVLFSPPFSLPPSFQGTYITLFDIDGEVLLEETPVPGNYKFEGLEFVY
jgi:hypothetical protein